MTQEAQATAPSQLQRGLLIAGRYVPILIWLPRYRKRWLTPDTIAGLTVWGTTVPTAIAYAGLAGMPAVTGLYTAFIAMFVYGILGTSRHLRVTTSSTMAVMSAALVGVLAGGNMDLYVRLSGALAVIVGVLLLLAGILRMGFVADFLSKAVVTGFVFGLAITIAVGQLGKVFGVPSGGVGTIGEVILLVANAPRWSPLSTALGIGSIVLIFWLKRQYPRVPAALVPLVLGILLVTLFNLDEYGVAVVGEIPTGPPSLTLPRVGFPNIVALFASAFGIVFLAVGESLGSARAFAARHHYDIDANQELLAMGAANVGTGLFQGFTADASLSTTATAEASGAKTQLSGIITAFLLFLTVLFLAPLFTNLPQPVLGAIVIVSVWGLMDVRELQRIRRARRTDFWLALVALFGVVLTEVLTGLLLAVFLSLAIVLYRTSQPYLAVLGKTPSGSAYVDVKRDSEATQVPGLLLVRIDAPLYFLNANTARTMLERILNAAEPPPQALMLDIGATTDLDIASQDMISELMADLSARKVDFYLANVRGTVRDRLRKTGLLDQLGDGHTLAGVSDAVAAFSARQEEQSAGDRPDDFGYGGSQLENTNLGDANAPSI